MGNPVIAKRRSLIIKQETTRGTLVTALGADFNIPFNQGIQFTMDIPVTEGDYASGDFEKFAGVIGAVKGTITCSVPMFHSGTNDVAPDIAKLFNLCGIAYTSNTGVSVSFAPITGQELGTNVASAGNPFSCIVQDVLAGGTSVIHTRFVGCLANGKIVAEGVGQPLVLQLEISGVFGGIVDGTLLALTGYDTTVPSAFRSATVTAFSTAHSISKFTLDFGNKIEVENDPTKAGGYLAAYISDRVPTFSFNPKVDLLATNPIYTRWVAGTEGSLSVSAGNWSITASKAQILTVADATQESIIAQEVTMRLNRVSGGYPFAVVHT